MALEPHTKLIHRELGLRNLTLDDIVLHSGFSFNDKGIEPNALALVVHSGTTLILFSLVDTHLIFQIGRYKTKLALYHLAVVENCFQRSLLFLAERNCQLNLGHSSTLATHSEEGVVVEH